MPKKNRNLIKRHARKQKLDGERVAETVCVTVYGSNLEKFSEAALPIPDGAFGIRITRPEKEVFV